MRDTNPTDHESGAYYHFLFSMGVDPYSELRKIPDMIGANPYVAETTGSFRILIYFRPTISGGPLRADHGNGAAGNQSRNAAAYWRHTGVFLRSLERARFCLGRDRRCFGAGQPRPQPLEGDVARAALSDAAGGAGQARAGDARRDLRRRRRHPAWFPQLRASCGRGADRRQLVPAVDTARIRPWLLHAGGRYRGAIQDDGLLQTPA